MLPPNLFSTYQGYKRDTDSIAAWLASTAKSYGFESDVPTTGPANKATSTRLKGLKGKARAAAKKKNASTTKTTPKSIYNIRIKDFVPLAEFIASQRNVTIPASLITTLQRVIAIRGEFSDRLADNGAAKDPSKDETHGYFVGVLGKVLEILEPQTKPATAPVSEDVGGKADPAVTIGGFINQFAALKMFEPSEDFINAPDVERPKPSEDPNVTYEAESLTSIEDVIAATIMLIKDLKKIRSRVQWIWLNWQKGLFDLAAAAIATNTAIDLARNLIDDVTPLINERGGLPTILAKISSREVANKRHDFSASSNLDLDEQAFDVYEETYILTQNSLATLKEEEYGRYDPRSNRENKSAPQKQEEDRYLLRRFFVELITVARGIPSYPVKDEFLRGIKELVSTREITFPLVFTAQVFLDIHHVLRVDADQAFGLVEKNLRFFETQIDEHLKFHKNIKTDKWPAINDLQIQDLQADIRSVLGDPIYDVKCKSWRERNQPGPIPQERHSILRMSPVISGLMLYRFRAKIWHIGISLANAWGSITYSLHLYNALKAEKLMSETWADMDVVRILLGDSNFFVGDPPRDPVGYFNNFCLQMGMTAAAFARNPRKNSMFCSRSGPRVIKDGGAPVSRVFVDRYVRDTGRIDWTAEDVAKVLERNLLEEERPEDENTFTQSRIDDPEKLPKKKNIKRNKFSAEKAKWHPEQLIRSLVLALNGEARELAFPYIVMHRKCMSLLWKVGPLIRRTFNVAVDLENELSPVVGLTLMAHVERIDGNLLLKSSVVVREFLNNDGSNCLGLLNEIGIPVEITSEEKAEDSGPA